ncbi:hypothetical protein HMPREF3144_10045 [Oligella sp. HMSC05A10]|nr:hypothetical protein HMPREF3144_10045 [Oligella sp. HMSC05A10]
MGFEDFQSQGVPVLSAKHVKTDKLVNIAKIRFAGREMYEKWMKEEVAKGDIVLTSEAPLGEVFYIDTDQKYVAGQRVFVLRTKKEILSPLYLVAWLTSEEGQKKLHRRASGSTVLGIKQSELRKIEVPVPSLLIQNKIANFRYDLTKKIEIHNQINDTLEAMAEAIFKSWFVDFDPVHAKIKAKAEGLDSDGINRAAMAVIASKSDDEIAKIKTESLEKYERLKSLASLFPDQLVESELGLIPEGWEVLSFSEWIQVTKGKSITKAKVNPGNVPVVAGGLEPAYYHNESNVKGPAITISASGANAGYVNLYYQDIWSSDSSYIAHNETKAFYVAYVCLKYRQKEIFSMQTGAAQPHIYPKDFERLMIVKPSEALLDSLEAIYQGFFNLISDNKKESITLAEIRDTLLPKLLSGEIEVA